MRKIDKVIVRSWGSSTHFAPSTMKEFAEEILRISVEDPNNYEKVIIEFETSEGIKIKITENGGLNFEMII